MSVNCSTCSNTSISLINGLQLCTHCGTEQDFVELMENASFIGDTHLNYTLGENKIKKFKENNSSKVAKDMDNDNECWTTYEAYNVILNNWCSALMKMGASPNVRETVFMLWIIYIKRSKVGFMDDESLGTFLNNKNIEKIMYGRDIKFLNSLEFEGKRRDRGTSVKTKVNNIKKRQISNKYKQSILVGLLNETIGKSDNLDERGGCTDDMNSISELARIQTHLDEKINDCDKIYNKTNDKIGFVKGRKYLKKMLQNNEMNSSNRDCFKLKRDNCLNISHDKLLALLYLGVLISKEDIFLIDILWWCKNNIIPYYSSTYLLDDKYKFLKTDVDIFKHSALSYDEIVSIATNMCTFLSIQAIPIYPIEKCVHKFLDMLNLPKILAKMIIRIIDQLRPLCTASIPALEIDVATGIILSIKLLYGLDGTHEHILSKFANNFNGILNTNDYKLFSYKDWCKNINKMKYMENVLSPVNSFAPINEKFPLESKKYSQYFWATGVWNRPQLEAQCEQDKSRWDVNLLKKLVDKKNLSIPEMLNKRSFFEKQTMEFLNSSNTYREENWLNDCRNTKQTVITDGESKCTSFVNDDVVNFETFSTIKKKLKKIGSKIIINEVEYSTNEEFGYIDQFKFTESEIVYITNLSNPLKYFWPIQDFLDHLSSLPCSFLFLIDLLASICHINDKELLDHYKDMEIAYISTSEWRAKKNIYNKEKRLKNSLRKNAI